MKFKCLTLIERPQNELPNADDRAEESGLSEVPSGFSFENATMSPRARLQEALNESSESDSDWGGFRGWIDHM